MGDLEIDAMSIVATAIADLDEAAQGRVLRWAAERYSVPLPIAGQSGNGPSGRIAYEAVSGADLKIAKETTTFQYFAELFARAQPKSEADKALVAAYWIQVHQKYDQWPSRLLNVELKHLGYSLSNVTMALSSNMNKKPQRVMQLKKSGSSKQANKIYKVTNEGIVYVQGMWSGGSV
ncbi:hypothetical protein M8C13_33060 [Crossiella sp. SN42]|uniref:hypothetical protein n=1 Tax=Crossiella sp. SN42 TaxID=2944808 RepID=UPI00207CBFE6|nr:hypothetical protein [Crossiella sp. SN42]MCO1580597.1 hypothetical protein [Crossiella sp. SN42]